MNVPSVLALALVALLPPTGGLQARTEPVRVVNGGTVSATGLFIMQNGGVVWGDNLLRQQTLRPGAFLPIQRGEGAGCRVDMLLVLRDGREAVRRDVDICVERVITLAPEAIAAVPEEPPPPRRGRQ